MDGYIIALPEGTEDEVQALTSSGKPVILFDRYFPGLKTDYVIINNRESTFNAAVHLADNGYKNIGFVTIDTVEQQMLDRLKGYEDGVKAKGLRANVIKIPYSNASNSRDLIAAYLQEQQQLDAVIFAANYLSMDGLRAIQRLELKIPENLAVVSFDDFELLEFSATTISAIAQPLERIAEEIMSILLKRLENPNAEGGFHQVVLPTDFNIRKSSLPLKNSKTQ